MPETSGNGSAEWRIGAVVRETGVSKDLIHHYLRQGLLPRSQARALYDESQVRLLRLIRVLRDDHHLPLDAIRQLFELFDFEPDQIEPLTHAQSLGKRIASFLGDTPSSPSSYTAREVADELGVTTARVEEYARGGLVLPYDDTAGGALYSNFDLAIVALCQRGIDLGLSFESFRTIASYLRVGFELEYAEFFRIYENRPATPKQALADLFARREVCSSFVNNVLDSLLLARLREEMSRLPPPEATLDEVIYRPSELFSRVHRLDAAISDARAALAGTTSPRVGGEGPSDPAQIVRLPAAKSSVEAWREVAELLLHAGRYGEAIFYVEEALERWPGDDGLRCARGRALVLLGRAEEGRTELLSLVEGERPSPLGYVFAGLSLLKRATAESRPETLLRDSTRIVGYVDAAVAASSEPGCPLRDTFFVRILGGYLLNALPSVFEDRERGAELLRAARRELEHTEPDALGLPGFYERLVINAAYLLFQCAPSERDRACICRLDPSSSFAESVFLADVPNREGS